MDRNNPIPRRKVLKQASVAGISAGVLSGPGMGKESGSENWIEPINGREAKRYIKEAAKDYKNSDIEGVDGKKYKLDKNVSRVAKIQLSSIEQIFVSLNFVEKGKGGSKDVSSTQETPSYVWSNSDASGAITKGVSVGEIREKGIVVDSSIPDERLGYEYISESKHTVDIFDFPGQDRKHKAENIQSIDKDKEIKSINIDIKNESVEVDSAEVPYGKRNSNTVSTQASGKCDLGFSATVAAVTTCTGGCGGCWASLLTRNIAGIMAGCGACSGCSIQLYCCIGAAAPDSLCASILSYVTSFSTNPAVIGFKAGIGTFILNGCLTDGEGCPV